MRPKEAAPSPKAPATPPQKEDRRWADEIAKQRRAMAKKDPRASRQTYVVEKEAEDTGCSLYSFFQCNGFERTFINEQRKDSRKKIEEDIAYWESEIARGVTSTPKGQMRYSTMVRILKEFVQYIDEYGGEKALQARFPNGRFKPLLDKKPASEL
mmetsp:Transcript_124851/g.296263  ORF Transcript_124851/g.296263 Transcript_124851/m.296263 type:complete len:155 (+) Transcript_124851:1-465(+)